MAGQRVSANAPYFRDMSFGVAFGYVLGAALFICMVIYYFQPIETTPGVFNAGVMFFRWGVHGFLGFALAAWLFRLFGRYVGTASTRKLFRSMPLTASFGVLMISSSTPAS